VSEVTITITPEMRVKVMHAETFTFVFPQDIEELEVDRFQAGVFYDELCTVLGIDPVAAGYQGVIDAVKSLSAGDEKLYSREPRQCQHGTILYGSCMLCGSEAAQVAKTTAETVQC
jgi:hypothetical protein